MPSIESACAMLRMARMDLDALSGMGDNPVFADEIVGFHAQQSIEKSLKAWLISRDVAYPRTHDLRHLLRLLEDSGANVDDYWPLMEYSIYSVQTRYEEGLLTSEELLDRVQANSDASRLWLHVEALLSGKGD